MRSLFVLIVLIAGCGRLGFDALARDAAGDGRSDAAMDAADRQDADRQDADRQDADRRDADLDAGSDSASDAPNDAADIDAADIDAADIDAALDAAIDASADAADGATDAPDASAPSRWLRVQHLAITFPMASSLEMISIDPVDVDRSVVIWTGQDTVNLSPLSALVTIEPSGDVVTASRVSTGEVSSVYFQVVELSEEAVDRVQFQFASRTYAMATPTARFGLPSTFDSTWTVVFWGGSSSTKVAGGPRDWTWAASSSFLVSSTEVEWNLGVGCCNDGESIAASYFVTQLAPAFVETVSSFDETISSALSRDTSIAIPFPERTAIVTGGPNSNRAALDALSEYVASIAIEDATVVQRMGTATGGPVTQRGQIVRFQPGVVHRLERGTIGVAGGALGAGVTLAPLRADRTIVLASGMTSPGETCFPALRLVGDREIDVVRSPDSYCTDAPIDVPYQVIEFE